MFIEIKLVLFGQHKIFVAKSLFDISKISSSNLSNSFLTRIKMEIEARLNVSEKIHLIIMMNFNNLIYILNFVLARISTLFCLFMYLINPQDKISSSLIKNLALKKKFFNLCCSIYLNVATPRYNSHETHISHFVLIFKIFCYPLWSNCWQ